MITPEPSVVMGFFEGGPDLVEVPAAGHLGVIEERCGGAHWALEYAVGYRCACGAAV
jgi:hypothetical protein